MLKKLSHILFPPKPTGIVFNFTADQLSDLKTLHGQKEYQTFQTMLDLSVNLYAEQMLTTSDDSELHRLRGFILGLRKAGTLVTEIIRQQEYEDARSTRAADRSERNESERQLAFYGTRYGGAS